MHASAEPSAPLTGRIAQAPASLLVDEVLRPQFEYELEHLLPGYLLIEQALLTEYVRLGLMDQAAAWRIAAALAAITPAALEARAATAMTDIAFSIETLVGAQVQPPVDIWHLDRSRNDLQACAQLMGLRRQVLRLCAELLELQQVTHALAAQTTRLPMPGYTHYQAAEVISPGFYLAALSEQLLQSCTALLTVYAQINASPLGAGAMAGQQLPWDRQRLARLLAFDRPQASALVSVASREAVLRVSAELAVTGTTLSRFMTDLLLWSGSQYGFIDLPDQLVGISSAMPQKRNFPLLERIRGRTAHMTGLFVDLALGQRNTPFTNLVEVSKEAGSHMIYQLQSAHSTLRLLTLVMQHLEFREDRMRAACSPEFFGGFQLANSLAQEWAIPYRRAQVLAGKFILAMLQQNLPPREADPATLNQLCAAAGFTTAISAETLRTMFDNDQNLWSKQAAGSTHPERVEELLQDQAQRASALHAQRVSQQQRLDAIPALIAEALGL